MTAPARACAGSAGQPDGDDDAGVATSAVWRAAAGWPGPEALAAVSWTRIV